MAQLALSNVISISVSAAGAGVGNYNTSNVALFTRDTPGSGFGSLGYKLYVNPGDVATDFGTSSYTFLQANALFSQTPNILANNGYLAIIPLLAGTTEIQTLTPSGTAASGHFVINYGSFATPQIQWDDTAAVIQGYLQANEVLRQVVVTGTIAAGLTITYTGVNGDATAVTVSSDTLLTAGSASVTFAIATPTPGVVGETIGAGITRSAALVQYFGIMAPELTSQTDLLAAAAIIQPLNKIGFFCGQSTADIAVGGKLDLLRSGGFTKTRGLYYGSTDLLSAVDFTGAYVGRALSVNFTGSNTTTTMHLKDLATIQPDLSLTQTYLTLALAAGADTYPSLQGVAKVFCSGANRFFDQVYNQEWLVGALQVAGFNFLAESSTKIPQTENGMAGLKAAYRSVLEQAVTCQYSAPGTWTSATTFGVQADFLANIVQRGYYIYSSPIATQAPADRAARIAPLVQIALKEAGAIQSSNVIVNINP